MSTVIHIVNTYNVECVSVCTQKLIFRVDERLRGFNRRSAVNKLELKKKRSLSGAAQPVGTDSYLRVFHLFIYTIIITSVPPCTVF